MSYGQETEQERMRRLYQQQGQDDLLQNFFGVSETKIMQDGSIVCYFDAKSPDGSEEKRPVRISPKNSPELNMDILRDARKRQHWYRTQRHEVEGIDVPPPEKKVEGKDDSKKSAAA